MSGAPINVEEGSSVSLSRIGKIATHEVQEMELERLDSLVATESQALAFTMFTLGILISTGVGWLAAENLSPSAKAIYLATMGCSTLLTMWFGSSWRRARRERPKLLATVRERSRIGEGHAKVLPPPSAG